MTIRNQHDYKTETATGAQSSDLGDIEQEDRLSERRSVACGRAARKVGAPSVLIVSNTAWNIFNFRSRLIQTLIGQGFRVVAAAPPDSYAPRVEQLGCTFRALPMDNAGTNPFRDLMLFYRLRSLLRTEAASVLLTFTVKPNVYGAMAAWSLGVPIICNVTGLGTAFLRRNWMSMTVSSLYRFALHRACHSFFQNSDHYDEFVAHGLAPKERSSLLPGSGIDTDRFAPQPKPPSETFTFLLFGRMLLDKGIGEYVNAARKIRSDFPDAKFCLMGFVDVANRSAIPIQEIKAWVDEGTITFLPEREDVREIISHCDCVVLPSYTEGMPRSLLEAAAMGKPLIATDVPGCRQVVEDGVNGFLVRARDVSSLADKMAKMLTISPDERHRMGENARNKMVGKFDERIVLKHYLDQIRKCTNIPL
jgi:glycosyltransferase involved in cell wall biosynthesis